MQVVKKRPHRIGRFVLFFTLLFVSNTFALGATISVPLRLGQEFFQQQVIKQMFGNAEQTFTAWNDGSGCNHLILSKPDVNTAPTGITLRMTGDGRAGTPIGELCLPLIPWNGFVDVVLRPVPAGNAIRLEIIDSSIKDADGKENTAGTIWNWTKEYVHPSLANIRIDFVKPLNDLKLVAPMLFAEAQHVHNILASLAIDTVTTNLQGVEVTLTMNAPDTLADSTQREQTSEPALSPEEVLQLEQTLRHWDVFITLVAKRAAAVADDEAISEQLLSILLNARHELTGSLTADDSNRRDPVRQLFLQTWSELSPVLKKISLNIPDESALDYIAFIGAGDALQAIDAVGPSLNLDISTDGLRRLARMIVPDEVQDPLMYDEEVDPELRRLFDFGPPLQLPEMEAPQPSGFNWFISRAWAQEAWDRSTLFKLNKWIPTKANIQGYLRRVLWLLEDVVYKVLRDNPLDKTYRDIFHPLMLAAAWQETCWRQFIEKDGERKPLRSSVGAVGIMQVLPRVWRGFYHPNALTWNINYNALAGGEILHHYLVHYAIRKQEHKRANNIHDLARATYAAYNGGPGHLTRYRSKKTPARLKRIDTAFWQKYQIIRDGDSLAVKQCYG